MTQPPPSCATPIARGARPGFVVPAGLVLPPYPVPGSVASLLAAKHSLRSYYLLSQRINGRHATGDASQDLSKVLSLPRLETRASNRRLMFTSA